AHQEVPPRTEWQRPVYGCPCLSWSLHPFTPLPVANDLCDCPIRLYVPVAPMSSSSRSGVSIGAPTDPVTERRPKSLTGEHLEDWYRYGDSNPLVSRNAA